jgi:outer membrane autotransporter protein
MPLSLGVSEPALAQACGPLMVNVTCTSAGNNYTGGISYLQTTLATDLHVNLDSDVNVTFLGAQPEWAVAVNNNGGGQAILTANGAAITANVPGVFANGLVAISTSGNAIVTASGPIQVVGNGIVALANGDLASVTYNGPGVTSSGSSATVIQAVNLGAGDAFIEDRGDLRGDVVGSGAPNGISGLFATAENGRNATVLFHSGTITAEGFFANGIFAAGGPDGSATVITDPGTTIIVQIVNPGDKLKPGIAAETSGSAAANDSVTVVAQSAINILGAAAADPNLRNDGLGIRAFSFADAPISVSLLSPGSITTEGGNGIGIAAASVGGSIAVNSSGPITTTNSGAFGILADSGNILNNNNMIINNPILTPGGPITVMASGAISTQGAEAHGIWAASTTGPVQVTATNVSTSGQFSTAINAVSTGINGTGGSNVTVNIPSGGSVMGGWQPDVTSVGVTYGLPAAGVILSSTGGTAALNNDGSIGALSDRAVAGDPQVINNGVITGFVQFTGGDNSILNNGMFNLRHLADTNGDGVRDTNRVAVADLGTGLNNSFTNNGMLALAPLPVTPSPIIDSTGQYLPLGNPNNTMALGGPLQGQLIGTATFTNSGTINLQANPAAGDVLLITGGRGGSQPGSAGGGTYISNGGALMLDTVLNQGGAATHSDTLVVDGTAVGPKGTTQTFIHNAGGAGAMTVGDGILVVQVLDPNRSAAGAFSLGSPITAGAFDYFLFKGGFSAGSSSNWYLRSEAGGGGEAGPGPGPGPGAPGGPLVPLYQPDVAVQSVIPTVARTLGLISLGTFNERQGDQQILRDDVKLGSWGRVFGQQTQEHFAQGAMPDFDGAFSGFQVGSDVWRTQSRSPHSDHVGFYVAVANATGNVSGSVDAVPGTAAGHLNLDANSFGLYWTHLGPTNWYIDAVLQGTQLYGSPSSVRGGDSGVIGTGLAASLEAGYPIMLAPSLMFEPQIQGIWQRTSLEGASDQFSTISYDHSDVFTGRVGALLRGTYGSTGAQWQPYLKGNVWWGSNGTDTVSFDGVGIPTARNAGPTVEGGGGITGKLTRNVSIYADASYLTSVNGERVTTVRGDLGLRVTW